MSKRSKSDKQPSPSDDKASRTSPDAAPPFSKRRRRLFIAIAITFPFIVLAASEGVLQLCGFGGHDPIVNVIGEFKGAQLATLSINGAASYFDRTQSTPGSIGVYTFSIPKPPNTVRVMLAGASAIKGYPQPMGLANSAFLQEMLSDVWPDRSVEVLNLGTTAVATFPVLDMLTQMLAYEPDVVIVYAGHNEFFGAYGVGSAQTGGNTPSSIRFAHWRNGLGLVKGLSRVFAPRSDSTGKALMEAMVGQANIAPGSPLREAAARNAGYHVGQMIERCQSAGVPIMICTLPSNEKDLSPVGEVDVSHLGTTDHSKLRQLVADGESKMVSDPASSIESLTAALEIYPDNARVHYLLGKAHLKAGDNTSAATHFRNAIDCDTMPWRAPSTTIERIVLAAKNHNVPLCDVQQAFRNASPDGIIGRELMDDHVHFSLRGQALLARTIVKALTEFGGACAVDTRAFEALPDWEAYANRLGANEYERYAVAHGLRNIFGVPFMRASNPDVYAHWDGFCKQLFGTWPPSIQRVAQEWQDPKNHRSVRRPLSAFVARAFIREKNFAEAKPLMEAATRSVPLYSTWNIEYIYSALLCEQKLHGKLDDESLTFAHETLERIRFMLRYVEDNPGLLLRFCGRIHQLCGEWKESIPILQRARKHLWEIEKVACDAALIEGYIRTGEIPRARALANEGIKNAGEFATHYREFLSAIPIE
jgi:lysophospholipase L1-like esterase